MSIDVTLPAIGESITEGILARWLVENGQWVDEGAPLYELETDKVSSEVAAEVSGVLKQIAQEGDTVEVGGLIAAIDPDAERPAAAATPEVPAPSPTPTPAAEPAPAVLESTDSSATVTPAARRLIDEKNLNASAITGTGRHGSITKSDVLAHLDTGSSSATPPPPPPPPPPAPAPSPKPAAKTPIDDGPGFSRQRMSGLRKAIAKRLVNAQRTAAILTTFNEVDMSACMGLRKRFKEAFAEKHQTGLGFMSFFTRAAVEALKTYPLINSRIDGDDIVMPDHVNMGVAVGTDRGLVVPVLRHAEDMGFADIERGIRGFAAKAREGSLTIQDMEGGTFTITNGGVYGSLLSTPIINAPQSGILGMHGIQDRPIAVNGEVVIRPMMYIALSYDHRIVDGAEAVGFLVRIKELIEAPEKLLFDL